MRTQPIQLALGAMLILLVGASCATTGGGTVPREAAGAATQAAGAAPGAGAARTNFPESGGTRIEEAEAVERGATVEGVVTLETPRYYRLNVRPGETVNILWYTQAVLRRGEGYGANPTLSILDENGGVLTSRMAATSATTESQQWTREELPYSPGRAGTVILQVGCQHCGNVAVRYRLMIE